MDATDLFVVIGLRTPRPEFVKQSLHTVLKVAIAPSADGIAVQTHPFGNEIVAFSSCARQNDLCSLDERMGQ
jgi:hypothetical protein